MLIITKTQPADNRSSNNRRTASRDKKKKQQAFNKILAVEMTQPPPKR